MEENHVNVIMVATDSRYLSWHTDGVSDRLCSSIINVICHVCICYYTRCETARRFFQIESSCLWRIDIPTITISSHTHNEHEHNTH